MPIYSLTCETLRLTQRYYIQGMLHTFFIVISTLAISNRSCNYDFWLASIHYSKFGIISGGFTKTVATVTTLRGLIFTVQNMIRRFVIEHDKWHNWEGYSPDLVKVLGFHQQLLLYFRLSGSTSF